MDRLTALDAFVRLNELGSFSAVARDLRVRQSTVSKWIAELERSLGVELVQRSTRSLRITVAGEQLLGDARELLTAYAGIVDRLGRRALAGRMRVSVPVVFGRLFVIDQVDAFLATHPELEIELQFADRYVNLIEENVDLAIRVGTPVDSNYRSHALGTTRRHLVASPYYLRQSGEIRTPIDLKNHQCLSHSGLVSGEIWRFKLSDKETVVNVRGRFVANNSEALLTMALRGHGIALLADWLVHDALASGDLVSILNQYDLPPAPIRALTAPTRFPSQRASAFIEHLKRSMRQEFSG
ncbi:MAG: LysR family transcriptional regulator [Myxococcota bacterium]